MSSGLWQKWLYLPHHWDAEEKGKNGQWALKCSPGQSSVGEQKVDCSSTGNLQLANPLHSPPNCPPVHPLLLHCHPLVLILLLPVIICHRAKLSSPPAHYSTRQHQSSWKAIFKTRIYGVDLKNKYLLTTYSCLKLMTSRIWQIFTFL